MFVVVFFSRILVDVGTSAGIADPGFSEAFDLHHVAFASKPLCWEQDTSNRRQTMP